MAEQIFFDDVAEGQELPPLMKPVTHVNILMYLGVVWLLDRIHFDHQFATLRRGLPDIVAPGNMAVDYYCQLLTGWAGGQGRLCKVGAQYWSFMLPGKTLECGGRITGKREEDGKGLVDLDIWIKNDEGANCVLGTAVVELPRR